MTAQEKRAERRRALFEGFPLNGVLHEVPQEFTERFFVREKSPDSEIFHRRRLRRRLKTRSQRIELEAYQILRGGKKVRYGHSRFCKVKVWDIYFDAPFGFVLVCGEEPCAVVTFDVVGGSFEVYQRLLELGPESVYFDVPYLSYPSPTIVVKQLQGVRGAREELRGIRWEKLLLALVVDWAFANGFREVRVLSARENRWYTSQLGEEEKKRFVLRYEVTPRRMGFRPSSNGKYSFVRCNALPPDLVSPVS